MQNNVSYKNEMYIHVAQCSLSLESAMSVPLSLIRILRPMEELVLKSQISPWKHTRNSTGHTPVSGCLNRRQSETGVLASTYFC